MTNALNPVLPLLALRSFAEVGRHKSIKRAAEVLGVTPGAVSQQVRALEERFETPLFIRTRYGVELTEAGKEIHADMVSAFDRIADGLRTLERRKSQKTLTISTVPSFAASWLVPRLGDFYEKHPEIEVRVEASSQLVDFRKGRVDVAIRHGLGDYSGLRATWLMSPVFLPVVAPEFFKKMQPVERPEDLLSLPLLQDSDRADWTLWFQAIAGLRDARTPRGPSFDDDFLLVKATIAGQGVALVRDIYVQDEISSGRLMLALDRPWPTQFAYYALTATEAGKRNEVEAFLDWISNQAIKPTVS